MFDRFSDRSRTMMGRALQASHHFNHDYIGTEHLLLGLLSEGTGVGFRVLCDLGVDVGALHADVESRLTLGTRPSTRGQQLPFTPLAKQVLEASLEAARALGDSYIGTEHLLLGLLDVDAGIAAETLHAAGATAEKVEAAVRATDRKSAGVARGAARPESSTRIGPLFTPLATTVLGYARDLASFTGVAVNPKHLLASLLFLAVKGQSALATAFEGVDIARLANAAMEAAGNGEAAEARPSPGHSPRTLRILAGGLARAADAGRVVAASEDLFAALVEDDTSPESTWLADHGVDVDRIRKA